MSQGVWERYEFFCFKYLRVETSGKIYIYQKVNHCDAVSRSYAYVKHLRRAQRHCQRDRWIEWALLWKNQELMSQQLYLLLLKENYEITTSI